MPPRPTYLIVETHAIARPLIAALGLKRSDALAKHRCFASPEVLLVESRAPETAGSPTVAAAATAAYLLGSAGYDEATRLFHIGSCEVRSGGGVNPLAGRVVLVNRVIDALSRRGYYPDILLAHEFVEAEIATGVDLTRPGAAAGIAEAPHDGPQLVDRELSGFLAGALTFLAPHQVYCLAAVTGAREGTGRAAPPGRDDGCAETAGTTEAAHGDRWDAEALVDASTGPILRLVEQAGQLLRPGGTRGAAAVRRAVDALAGEMRLTAAQTAQLRALAEEAAVRGQDVEKLLAAGSRPVRTKQQRNRGFDELKRLFRH